MNVPDNLWRASGSCQASCIPVESYRVFIAFMIRGDAVADVIPERGISGPWNANIPRYGAGSTDLLVANNSPSPAPNCYS